MTYNPQNAEPLAVAELQKDSILDGAIIDITDGKIKDFVSEKAQENWKGDTDQTAINTTIEVKAQDGKPAKISQVFTYLEDAGITKYTKGSNMGKFVAKYGQPPKAGMQVKIVTNSDGFGRIKLD